MTVLLKNTGARMTKRAWRLFYDPLYDPHAREVFSMFRIFVVSRVVSPAQTTIFLLYNFLVSRLVSRTHGGIFLDYAFS